MSSFLKFFLWWSNQTGSGEVVENRGETAERKTELRWNKSIRQTVSVIFQQLVTTIFNIPKSNEKKLRISYDYF